MDYKTPQYCEFNPGMAYKAEMCCGIITFASYKEKFRNKYETNLKRN